MAETGENVETNWYYWMNLTAKLRYGYWRNPLTDSGKTLKNICRFNSAHCRILSHTLIGRRICFTKGVRCANREDNIQLGGPCDVQLSSFQAAGA